MSYTKTAYDVIDIEKEESLFAGEQWVVTVDGDDEEVELTTPTEHRSETKQALADKIADLADSDADLEAVVKSASSPLSPDTHSGLDDVREA